MNGATALPVPVSLPLAPRPLPVPVVLSPFATSFSLVYHLHNLLLWSEIGLHVEAHPLLSWVSPPVFLPRRTPTLFL